MSKMLTRFDRVPNVHKIAVVRANALGDFICVLPALTALRIAYPDSEIVLLAKKWHATFLKDRPGPIDRVVVVPPYGGVGEEPAISENPSEVRCFFNAMREEHFDIAIQVHGGGRYSNPFVQQLGARVTVGLKTPDAVPLDRWVPYVLLHPEILRYLEVVSLVGATETVLEPRVCVTEKDLIEAQSVVDTVWPPRVLVALHPGAGAPERRWPPEKFAAVGDALVAAGAHVVITATKEEQPIAKAVMAAMRTEAQDLSGCLSLGGLAGLLSRCRVVVSNDSGPLHLAAAVGAATVGIYWCWNFINYGSITRSRHRPAISWQLTCPVCHVDQLHNTCDHHPSLVADITTEEVIASALDLFCHEGNS